MNKKGKISEFSNKSKKVWKTIKSSYLYKLVAGFLSTACTIILVLLLIVGGLMFFFNMKAKSLEKKGQEYVAPFGLYTIISGSMEPNVEVYDVVIAVDTDISNIKVGDIITFISNWDVNYGLTVTHRVVKISKNINGEYQLTTKGDNNQTADVGTVTQSNLVGKVVGRLPQLGQLQFFLATKMGWFLVVFIPALAIIIFDMIKIFKLYVLKGQIDNVKTSKEAEKERITKELESKRKPLNKAGSKSLTPRTKVPDENIDTVELPRVTKDGKITNTSELPVIYSNNETGSKTDLPEVKTKNKSLEGTIKIPLIRRDKNESIPKVGGAPLKKRKQLKKRH